MVKNPLTMQETQIPGLGRSPGEGNGNPLQYSCLGNPMDIGAWKGPRGHKEPDSPGHACTVCKRGFWAEARALLRDPRPDGGLETGAGWATWVQSLGREDPLEREMAIHSSTIAWKIP